MISEWFQRVGSSVPRGFSRYFILELLKKKPYTGKQIIDYAVEQSQGVWKPSPGLIYPLLGRLLDEGLVEETSDGKYEITKKGRTTAADLDRINEIVKKQLNKIRFPKRSTLGAIVRNGTMLLPKGVNAINPGESVIVFTLPDAIEKVQALFSKKR